MEEIKFLALSSVKFVQIRILAVVILTGINTPVHSQCTNTNQFPASPIIASQFNDTLIITNMQEAGQYYIIQNLAVGRNYQFSSSNPEDFITVRDKDGITALAFGVSPVSYMVTGDDIVTVHINLSAGCGTETAFRTTTATCLDCTDVPGRFGIAATDPAATLDVQGGVRVGNVTRPAEAGMIRWNEEAADFEGFDGQKWRSFTKAQGGWGIDANTQSFENQIIGTQSYSSAFPSGESLDISGDQMIMGDPYFDQGMMEDIGTGFIYQHDNGHWQPVDTLFAAGQQASSCFGCAVDLFGDRVIIGAQYHDVTGGNLNNQGAAYIFRRSGDQWIEEAELIAFDGDSADRFGYRVALSGEFAAVSAIWDDVGQTNDAGSVYLYQREGTNWAFTQKITGNLTTFLFGYDVGIHEKYLVIGAPLEEVDGLFYSGRAYVYQLIENGTWIEQTTLFPAVSEANSRFAASVDVFGEKIIIGRPEKDVDGVLSAGTAYIYEFDGIAWQETEEFMLSEPGNADYFGEKVGIFKSTVIIGSRLRHVHNVLEQGAVFVYEKKEGSWDFEKMLLASDGRDFYRFGRGLCIDEKYIGVTSESSFPLPIGPTIYTFNLND